MGLALRTVKFDRRTGALDQKSLDENLSSEVAGIYLENPNFFGVVEEGALADLLLVDGNPLENIKLVEDPDKNFLVIMKDGTVYKDIVPK